MQLYPLHSAHVDAASSCYLLGFCLCAWFWFFLFLIVSYCSLPPFSCASPQALSPRFGPKNPTVPLFPGHPRGCGRRGAGSAPRPGSDLRTGLAFPPLLPPQRGRPLPAPSVSRNAVRNSPARLSGEKAPPGRAIESRGSGTFHEDMQGSNGIKLLAVSGSKQNTPGAGAGAHPGGGNATGGQGKRPRLPPRFGAAGFRRDFDQLLASRCQAPALPLGKRNKSGSRQLPPRTGSHIRGGGSR